MFGANVSMDHHKKYYYLYFYLMISKFIKHIFITIKITISSLEQNQMEIEYQLNYLYAHSMFVSNNVLILKMYIHIYLYYDHYLIHL